MFQLQNCSVMSTKNESYCENDKKEIKSQGEGSGGCVQRMEAIVKREKKLGGVVRGRCLQRSEAFVKIPKTKLRGGRVGRGLGWEGGQEGV